jgi:hypothetical protein
MRFNAQCPACDSEIKFTQILIRPTPFQLKCSRCEARIRVSGVGPAAIVAVLLAAVGVGACLGYVLHKLSSANEISLFTAIFLLVVMGCVVQIGICLLVVNKGKLKIAPVKIKPG